jgi:amino acid transporter/nucleotide-binding universal stress UspA family protein
MGGSVEESESGGGDIETDLSRDMSLLDITMIGIGAMIGAGVFALTSFAAGLAGPALMLAFLFNGIVGILTAMSYAELGAGFPEAGGGYLWVKESLVDPNGFYAGWMSWFAHAVACSLYAVTFAVFFTQFAVIYFGLSSEFVLFGFLSRTIVEKILAALVVIAFVYINYKGAEETGKAEVFVVALKLIILGLFIIFGVLATLKQPNWPAIFLSRPGFFPKGVVGVLGAMGYTYVGFEGYEVVVQSGEEVVNPGETLPKAVIISMIIVIPIYILVAFAAMGGLHQTQHLLEIADLVNAPQPIYAWELLGGLGELGLIQAAGQFMPYGEGLLIVAGLAATMSAINATVYSSSRVSFAMGRDRALPDMFKEIHPNQRTPHLALFFSMLLIIIMAVALPIEAVAASSGIMFILLFIQVDWAVIRMRTTHPDLPRTFTVPYMPWPPLIAIAVQVLMLPFLIYTLGLEAIGIGTSNHGLLALATTAIWMGLGLIVYYGYSEGRHAEQREEETPTVVSENTTAHRDKQLLVPIANPDSIEQLMTTALDIAKSENAEIRVMSVVTVPQQTPLEEGRQFVDDQREVLDNAIEFANEEDPDVPVSGTIRIGHSVSKAILNTTEQDDVDFVLMGWRGRSRRRDVVLGSNVDEVVTKAKCDVLVKRKGPVEPVESILVPTAGGPHTAFAGQIAGSIARSTDADIELVTVVSPSASEDERTEAEDLLDETAGNIDSATIETTIVEGDDISEAIIEQSSNHDVTVIGASREGLLQQLVFGAIPEKVATSAEGTVIMAKRHLGITSRLQRWFERKSN